MIVVMRQVGSFSVFETTYALAHPFGFSPPDPLSLRERGD
jgi:hypothetical protein